MDSPFLWPHWMPRNVLQGHPLYFGSNPRPNQGPQSPPCVISHYLPPHPIRLFSQLLSPYWPLFCFPNRPTPFLALHLSEPCLECLFPSALHGAPSPPWVPTQRSPPPRGFPDPPAEVAIPLILAATHPHSLLFVSFTCLSASPVEPKFCGGSDLFCLNSCVPST